MRFRPCIDIHNGKVKQIVGGSLSDGRRDAKENFVSEKGAAYYAALYKEKGLYGGHMIMLNRQGTAEYEASRAEAMRGLAAYPGGMQIGGGIDTDNAISFIEAGASHVIVTSYLFEEVNLSFNKIHRLVDTAGKQHIVFDLSCRYNNDGYYIVTNRWQTFTEARLDEKMLYELAGYCDEFLIHGVDVEGLKQGIDEGLLRILGNCDGLKITYAGGIRSLDDIYRIEEYGRGGVDYTVGSALDIFGGDLPMDRLIRMNR